MNTTLCSNGMLRVALATLIASSAAPVATAQTVRVPLHSLPALSTVASTATGSAVVDLGTSVVTFDVQGLPPLPSGSTYAGLLVHNVNVPGLTHSVAIDAGPGGDIVIDVGTLGMEGPDGQLTTPLDPSRLAGFQLDLVAVVRRGSHASDELVIGGIVSVLQKSGGMPPPLGVVLEGAKLFSQERFEGNGRTCATCHPPANAFTLDPAFIASLPLEDTLFVAKFVPWLGDLENPALMRGPRALILENIDGFDRPPVFRGTPHILNAALTAPYGLSGDVPTLGEFALGAIVQHAPRRLDRVPGVDFRLPTQEELDALEAFQLSVFAPPDRGFDVRDFLATDQQRRGADLFFGSAKCSLCHGGPVLGEPSPGLERKRFDTGVVDLPINRVAPPECPACGPLGVREAGGDREFDVPPLMGIARTAPFFHDNSAPTLRDAVAFYDSSEFQASPAGRLVGGVTITSQEIDDITAFLEALTPCGNGAVDHGEACDDGAEEQCRADCTAERCGDGIVDPGEKCDDGAANGGDDCCSTACTVVDLDGDGICNGKECLHVGRLAGPMSQRVLLVLDEGRTGPGGGDDSFRIDAVFSISQAFDLVTQDLYVTAKTVETDSTLFSSTLAAPWVQGSNRHRWSYRRRGAVIRRAVLSERAPGTYRLRVSGRGADLIPDRPSFDVRLVIEIGRGPCVESRLVCAVSTARQVCRP